MSMEKLPRAVLYLFCLCVIVYAQDEGTEERDNGSGDGVTSSHKTTEGCSPNPCNGETCVWDETNGVNCICLSGAYGKYCEGDTKTDVFTAGNLLNSTEDLNITSFVEILSSTAQSLTNGTDSPIVKVSPSDCSTNPCKNGGKCSLDETNEVVCSCLDGSFGRYCEDALDVCFHNPCGANGECIQYGVSYKCECTEKFTGQYCEEEVTVNSTTSEIRTESIEAVEPNSTVSESTTVIRPTTASTAEREPTPNTEITDCSTNPCKHSGTCFLDETNEIACKCLDGSYGSYCEDALDLCLDNPCGANGECIQNEVTFQCKCRENFTGLNCEEEVTSNSTATEIMTESVKTVEANSTISGITTNSTTTEITTKSVKAVESNSTIPGVTTNSTTAEITTKSVKAVESNSTIPVAEPNKGDIDEVSTKITFDFTIVTVPTESEPNKDDIDKEATRITFDSTKVTVPTVSELNMSDIDEVSTKTTLDSTSVTVPTVSEPNKGDIDEVSTKTTFDSTTVTVPTVFEPNVSDIDEVSIKTTLNTTTVTVPTVSEMNKDDIDEVSTKITFDSTTVTVPTVFEPNMSDIDEVSTKTTFATVPTVSEPNKGDIGKVSTKITFDPTIVTELTTSYSSTEDISTVSAGTSSGLMFNDRKSEQIIIYSGCSAGALLLVILPVVAVFVCRRRIKQKRPKLSQNMDSTSVESHCSTTPLA